MRTAPAFSFSAAIPGFSRFAAVVAKRVDVVRRAIDGHRAMAQLAQLDEHALRDIGLTRTDVADAAHRPLAEDPTIHLARVVRTRRASVTLLHREAEQDWR